MQNIYLKGNWRVVDGRIQVRSYDTQDGQRRWVTEVIGENVRFLSPKEGSPVSQEVTEEGPVAQTSTGVTYGHEIHIDDDIPF